MTQNVDKRTASEKIQDLERAVMSGFQVTNNITRDIMVLKDALKLLGTKLEATAMCINADEKPTVENVTKYMLQLNTIELQGKVANLVNQGILAPIDEVSDAAFVVGSEQEADGKIIHPRVQFVFGQLEKENQDTLRGKKVGDLITFKEDKLRLLITEIYNIVAPKAPAPTADEAAEQAQAEQSSNGADQTAAAAPAAPVADQSGPSAGN